jgi:hypothetical protein
VIVFDHAPFYWKPEGFETEDEVATWLTLLGAEGVSVEIAGARIYFRSLDDVRHACDLAADACEIARMDRPPPGRTRSLANVGVPSSRSV